MRDLIPWGRSRAPARREEASPFFTLHREMNRLFDEAFRSFGTGLAFAPDGNLGWPSVEVSDDGKEVRVTAELPGLDEKDIEIEVDDGVLVIRGEKRTEIDDKDRRYSERTYGRFERRLALPSDVEEDRARATFKKGVLAVTLPRSEHAQQNVRRIPINI